MKSLSTVSRIIVRKRMLMKLIALLTVLV